MKWLREYFNLGVLAAQATITGTRRPLGYSQILNATLASSTGIVLPAAIAGLFPAFAIIQCQGGVVRWRDDGTAPTASVGMSIPSGGELDYSGDLNAIRFISSSGTPIVDISVYA